MNKIDFGFVNRKQLNRITKEAESSDLDIIEIHVLKLQKEMSIILEFRNENERIFFDRRTKELVKDLNRLRNKE